MAYQLMERPHRYSYSKNPVRYFFNITNPDTPGCALEVELYIQDIDGDTGTLINSVTLYPNSDGEVYFYCEDMLDAYLDWQLPDLADNDVVAVKSQIKKYWIRYRQVSAFNTVPAWATEENNIRLVIKGGVAKEKFSRNNFFVNYLVDEKAFLTWLPENHLIGAEERRYLTYFHNSEDLSPELFLKARTVYVDGTQETATKSFPALSETRLFHVPAGIAQLGLLDLHPDKQLWYYSVSVEDAGGNVFANPYRLNVDYRQFYDVFSFVYHNSLGGVDTVRVKGDYDIEVTRDFTETQSVLSYDYDFATTLPIENGAINITHYDVYKGDVGWLNTSIMQDALKDMLLSGSVYRVVFGRWLPVMHLQKTQKMRAKEDTKWSFELQWRYTYDNTQYTPAGRNFGIGVNDELPGDIYGTCTAPVALAVELLEYVAGGAKYRFTWSEVGGAVAYEIYIQNNTEQTELLPQVVDTNTVDVVLADEGDYSWRVRTQCGTNDYSGFSYGPGFTVEASVALCQVPDSLSVLLVSLDNTTGTMKFVWTAVSGVPGYYIEWRVVGSAIWNSQFVTEPNYTVGLNKTSQYECRVRTKCSESSLSSYKYGDNFIPNNMIGLCSKPKNLTVERVLDGANLNQHYAIIRWEAGQGTQDFQLETRRAGYTGWVVVNNIQTSYIIRHTTVFGLSYYDWRVKANCIGSGVSDYEVGPGFWI